MKKLMSIQIVFSICLFSMVTSAAPYYRGLGCNSEGTSCVFGTPTYRVASWFEVGNKIDLGNQCENFIARIDQRVMALKAGYGEVVNVEYKKFSAHEIEDKSSGLKNSIECFVELHSENGTLLIKNEIGNRHFWTCEDKKAPGFCHVERSVCEQDLVETLQDPTILQAKVMISSSLLQGEICQIRKIRASLKK